MFITPISKTSIVKVFFQSVSDFYIVIHILIAVSLYIRRFFFIQKLYIGGVISYY